MESFLPCLNLQTPNLPFPLVICFPTSAFCCGNSEKPCLLFLLDTGYFVYLLGCPTFEPFLCLENSLICESGSGEGQKHKYLFPVFLSSTLNLMLVTQVKTNHRQCTIAASTGKRSWRIVSLGAAVPESISGVQGSEPRSHQNSPWDHMSSGVVALCTYWVGCVEWFGMGSWLLTNLLCSCPMSSLAVWPYQWFCELLHNLLSCLNHSKSVSVAWN